MRDKVIRKSPRVEVFQIGRGRGIAVRLRDRDGWQIRREWASRESAIAAHERLARERYWEGATHLEAVRLLRGSRA